MANFSGTVTNIGMGMYEVGTRSGHGVYVRRHCSIVLSSQGGATNKIPATALGFRTDGLIGARCLLFTDGSSVKRWVALFTDNTNLYVADPQVSTDADRGKAADVTGTLVMEVDGYV